MSYQCVLRLLTMPTTPASTTDKTPYIGRFAPSPSGLLHMGSLVCALASYLDVRANGGKWLVRIEDIDPPREQKGASAAILQTLQAHHLHWDDDVIYQSDRSLRYQAHLQTLQKLNLAYPCNCTRARLKKITSRYDQHCLNNPPTTNTPTALRLNIATSLRGSSLHFNDDIQGDFTQNIDGEHDFIIHRKDQLFAYQLAVNTDDIDQGVTHIVRGCDLLDTTFDYIALHRTLLTHTLQQQTHQPQFCHIPVVLDQNGRKMSKQNHAPAINNQTAEDNLLNACRFLHINTDSFLNFSSKNILLQAQAQWPAAKASLKNIKEQGL